MSNDKPVDGPQTPEPHHETQPIGAATPAESTPEAAPEAGQQHVPPPVSQPQSSFAPATPALRQRFMDRLWGIKSMIAVALAAVVLGGLGGAAIAKAGDGGDQGDRFGPGGGHGGFDHRGGPGRFGEPGPGGFGQDGPGQPGVVPPSPSTAPTSGSTSSKNS
ncbi:MAG: hypothetical protein ABI873_18660 [Marmoricola sp.]